MLKSYITIALRNLLKRKGYSAINLAGLSVGIAAVILIFFYAQHELGYDRFHERSDDVFLIYKERVTPTGTQVTRDTWIPLASRLKAEYPAVEEAVRMWTDTEWVRAGAQRFEESVTYTDPSLFDVFSFPLAAGDAESALANPTSAVISYDVAAKYFGDDNPLGQRLTIDNVGEYTVTGVFQPIPANSSIAPDIAINMVSVPGYAEAENDWGGSFLFTYLLLRPDGSRADLEARFPALISSIWDAEVASRTNFKLEPLADVYDATTGNRRYAYILLAVALVILLIGAINFTNLATARSLERAKEIGMRKALGAQRRQLTIQFIGESTLLSLGSLVVGIALVLLTLPLFNSLYGLNLSFDLTANPLLPAVLIAFGVGVGFLAGAYPALVVSRFNPIATLRGGKSSAMETLGTPRRVLVVTQFALAAALISGTLIMESQVEFLQQAELKFDSENVIVVSIEASDFDDPESAARRIETFKNEVARSTSVSAASSSSHAPGQWQGWFSFVVPEGWGDQNPLRMRLAFVDDAYFETYGISLVQGRAFDPTRATDEQAAVIINEAAMASFGWQDAIGRILTRGGDEYTVVGVARDYHFNSLRNEIAPVLHFYRQPENDVHSFIAARVMPGEEREALAAIGDAWARLDPSRPLPYEFADQTFANLYEREQRLASVIGAFTILAILIACLGLFGLASWSVAQRTKEVGIRKVLGASHRSIVMLLSKDFIVLVVVALIVAIPISYVAMSKWLADFAYRVEMRPTTFALAGGAALLIAFVTVSTMAMRASIADPVTTLRYE